MPTVTETVKRGSQGSSPDSGAPESLSYAAPSTPSWSGGETEAQKGKVHTDTREGWLHYNGILGAALSWKIYSSPPPQEPWSDGDGGGVKCGRSWRRRGKLGPEWVGRVPGKSVLSTAEGKVVRKETHGKCCSRPKSWPNEVP